MKPSWDDAPEWAKFIAMDGNGDWYWYEHEPEWSDEIKSWDSPKRVILAYGFVAEDTLERRP